MKKCEQGTNSSSGAKTPVPLGLRDPVAHMKFSIPPDSIPGGHAGMDARLKRGPRIHPTACVVPGATVIGDVTLMEESSVWFGAVLRGDINRIIIGPRSNVQDNAVVHIDTPNETRLGELVTVGHSAIVHACTIDDEVLIGMGQSFLMGRRSALALSSAEMPWSLSEQ